MTLSFTTSRRFYPDAIHAEACATTLRRRFENSFRIYRPLAASRQFYDNSVHGSRRLIASGGLHESAMVFDPDLWNNVNREWTEHGGIGKERYRSNFGDGKAIEEALDRAYRRAVRQHRQNGVPMVFWENGEIIKVPADQLPDLQLTDEKFSTVITRTVP
jgi:hypothetical protein